MATVYQIKGHNSTKGHSRYIKQDIKTILTNHYRRKQIFLFCFFLKMFVLRILRQDIRHARNDLLEMNLTYLPVNLGNDELVEVEENQTTKKENHTSVKTFDPSQSLAI